MIPRLLALIFITVGSAYLHGELTNRWSTVDSMQPAIDFVNDTPKQLGKWEYQHDAHEMDDSVIRELGVTGYIGREYSDGETTVSLLLMTGHTDRLIRHTPDYCYASVGNDFLTEPTPQKVEVDGVTHEFLTLRIRPNSELRGDFTVVYGFLHDGVFSATRTPRWEFHGTPRVEKIQVLCEANPEDETAIPEPAADFLQELCRYCNEHAVR